MDVIEWLLDGEPAVRWQVMRDLTDADAQQIAAERGRVAHEGLGGAILARQQPDGAWHEDGRAHWMPTLRSMSLLRAIGADPADPIVDAAVTRVANGFRWHEEFGSKTFFEGEVEPCINGATLAIGGHFGHASERLGQRLLDEQLADGGWNCEAPKSTRSSFHTTICVLEGLLAWERVAGGAPRVAEARRRGEEYLLERSLYRRRSTGEVVNPSFLAFAFPTRYCYDVLRALDYFRQTGAPPDARLEPALRVVEDKRQPDGTWLLDFVGDEGLGFAFGESAGEPSRWITLRAMRVLKWNAQARPRT